MILMRQNTDDGVIFFGNINTNKKKNSVLNFPCHKRQLRTYQWTVERMFSLF